MKKRLIAMLMAGMMVFTMAPAKVFASELPGQTTESQEGIMEEESQDEILEVNTVQDEEESLENREFPVGGVVVNPITISEEEAQNLSDSSEIITDDIVGAEGSQNYETSWDKYSSNYIYNRLKSNEKKCWDDLRVLANYYLITSENAQAVATGSGTFYALGTIRGDKYGLSINRLEELYLMFTYSNPQFYFLDGSYVLNESYNIIGPCCYSSFAKGAVRGKETAKMGSKINTWTNQISKGANDIEKAKIAHDLIIKKVRYDNNYLAPNPNTPYHQSAYSVFCDDYTVCAGYTKAFEILMNGVGIDTIGVTSEAHAWNKVCINDSWYNVDLTWNDLDGYMGEEVYYLFFNRSDVLLTGDLEQNGYHTMESMYSGLVPKCTLDSRISQDNPFSTGTYSKPSVTVKAPTIKLSKSSKKYVTVTLASEAGAEIYYTTDGINPSSSYSRSYRYTRPFNISSNVNLKVIAVKNTKKDSKIVSQKVYGKVYTVTFNSLKGSRISSQKIYTNDLVKQPSSPKRSGYVFAGWYKDGKCKSAWNFKSKITKNITLYAKWAKKCAVKFDANRGSVKTKSKSVGYKETYGTLPAPVRKGYSFSGWYTKKSGGSRITERSKVNTTKTITLYAQWKKVGVVKTGITRLINLSGNKMEVSIKKISGAKGYQIRYDLKANMKSAKLVETSGTKKNIGKLTKGKKYYVQVRAYKVDSAGRKIFGAWSAPKSVTIKK